jgi:hypothetical protein
MLAKAVVPKQMLGMSNPEEARVKVFSADFGILAFSTRIT